MTQMSYNDEIIVSLKSRRKKMKRRILTILFAAMVMFANWVPSTLAQAEETNEMSEGENDMASSVYTGAGSTYSAKDYYEDTEKPVVNAVQLKKGDDILKKEDVLVPGEKVHISVQATDNVGFGGATVNFQTGGTASASIENVRKTVNLTYQEDSQSFEGDMEITDVMLSGNWIISEVCVYDTSYNTT